MKSSAIDFVRIGVIMFTFSLNVPAQTAKNNKVYSYKAVVSTSTQQGKITGILDEVSDSSIYIFADHHRIRIPAASIREIRIRRVGSAGRGALMGGLAGLGVGLIAGFADGDDECEGSTWCIMPMTAGEKAILGGFALGSIGALIGCIIGSTSRAERVVINEDQNSFEASTSTLKKYALSARSMTQPEK